MNRIQSCLPRQFTCFINQVRTVNFSQIERLAHRFFDCLKYTFCPHVRAQKDNERWEAMKDQIQILAHVDSEKLRKQALSSALVAYAILPDRKREELPKQISALSECVCEEGGKRAVRKDLEEKIFNLVADRSKEETLRISFVGSGDLLQEWAIVAGLILMGYRKLQIDLIDPNYSEETRRSEPGLPPCSDHSKENKKVEERFKQFSDSLNGIAKKAGPPLEMQIQAFNTLKQFNETHQGKKSDYLVAIDFFTGTYAKDLDNARENVLAEEGKLIYSASDNGVGFSYRGHGVV